MLTISGIWIAVHPCRLTISLIQIGAKGTASNVNVIVLYFIGDQRNRFLATSRRILVRPAAR